MELEAHPATCYSYDRIGTDLLSQVPENSEDPACVKPCTSPANIHFVVLPFYLLFFLLIVAHHSLQDICSLSVNSRYLTLVTCFYLDKYLSLMNDDTLCEGLWWPMHLWAFSLQNDSWSRTYKWREHTLTNVSLMIVWLNHLLAKGSAYWFVVFNWSSLSV